MRSWRFGVLVTTLSVIISLPSMARSQTAEENPAKFIERWIIPDARAADPIAPPDAQPRPPGAETRQPENAAGAPAVIEQGSKSEARGFVGKASFYSYTRGKT